MDRTCLEQATRSSTETKPLLVWDMFKFYLTENTKENVRLCHVDMAVIPEGLTSFLQPLDICLNKPLKEILRKQWNIFWKEKKLKSKKDKCGN